MVVLPALRSLLRFLHVEGHTGLPLAGVVPAGRSWKPGLPRAASADGLHAVLPACDRESAGGRRDYAIVLAMTRLALRGGEVARLRLANVGWRSGELTIAGKGGRTDILPLPADVGEAMADYLLHARPATTSPNLLVAMKAPFTGLTASAITQVVGRACERAGVPWFGPHRIRHAAACCRPARRWRRSASCCATPSSAPRRSTPGSIRPGWPSWPCPARQEPRDEHDHPRRGLPGDAPFARLQTAR
jgi:integrase/recombinase XerD